MDIGEWTPQVLTEGLPPLPDRLAPSQTLPVALFRGEHHGAVLFVRLWRNGQFDCDCAIAERGPGGGWEQPNGWGGGSWIEAPLIRSEKGWDGAEVLWKGLSAVGDVRAVRGAAAMVVAVIDIEQGNRSWTVPIGSPCGAFVVLLETPGLAALRAVGSDGEALGEIFRIGRGPGPA